MALGCGKGKKLTWSKCLVGDLEGNLFFVGAGKPFQMGGKGFRKRGVDVNGVRECAAVGWCLEWEKV